MKVSQITMKIPFHFYHLLGEAVIIVVDHSSSHECKIQSLKILHARGIYIYKL